MVDRTLRFLLLAGAALAATPAAAQTVGVNSAVVNDVRMTTQANRTLHKAVVRERVSLGNDIVTGKASRLQVVLLDRTTFTVGANARIKVDRFVYDPNRQSSAVGLSVGRGAFRFMSGRPTHNAPGQSSIRTPVASIGIRGTIVDGVVGPDAVAIAKSQPGLPPFTADSETASLILLRGPGATAPGEVPGGIDVMAGGATVALDEAGLAVFVPRPGAAPIGPFRLTPAGSARLIDLLSSPAYSLPEDDIPGARPPDTPVRQLPPRGQGDPVAPPGGAAGDPAIGQPQPPRI
ncbi:MAG: FecR domain-containing protein [Pseudomonadota bacterium]